MNKYRKTEGILRKSEDGSLCSGKLYAYGGNDGRMDRNWKIEYILWESDEKMIIYLEIECI
jgi:hypothetical protein